MSRNSALGFVLLVLSGGCATPPVRGLQGDPVVYPLPPAEPRIQYLGHFSGSRDFVSDQGAFSRFVFGTEKKTLAIQKPYGVDFDGSGRMIVCDVRSAALGIFDFRKSRFSFSAGEGPAALKFPVAVAFGPDGERYVVDTKRQVVVVTDREGKFSHTLGDPTSLKPVSVAASKDYVFVGDTSEHRVLVFDRKDRTEVQSLGLGEDGKGTLGWPVGLSVDPDGNVVVVDTLHCRVHRYTPDGEELQSFGQAGKRYGDFVRPKGVALDRRGVMYVVDTAFQCVQMFDPEARMLMAFGRPGSPGELYMPAGIAISYDLVDVFNDTAVPGYAFEYVIAVTSQFGPNKVNLFGFLKKVE